MKIRVGILILSALMIISILVACGNKKNEVTEEKPVAQEKTPVDKNDLPIMSMEEVAENDGLAGRDAYVVVDGIVYDVTDSDLWANGMHNGNQAGQDLTEQIKNDSPHGVKTLERDHIKAIGRIEE